LVIEEIDQRLEDWAAALLPGVSISLEAPGPPPQTKQVDVYLLDVSQTPAPRTVKRPPLQLSLRYLVTAWAETTKEAHRMLGNLMFAAMQDASMQVELEAAPLTLWSAFGTTPRPSFLLRVPLSLEHPETVAKPVLQPMIIRTKPVCNFNGLLIGRPGGHPLAGVAVGVPALGLSARSDRNGRFTFPTVPSQLPLDVRISAKGQQFNMRIDIAQQPALDPWVIALDLLEE
jgi:hypothetical protein